MSQETREDAGLLSGPIDQMDVDVAVALVGHAGDGAWGRKLSVSHHAV